MTEAAKGAPTGRARCQVCQSPQRSEIELMLAGGGASFAAIGRSVQINHQALRRHWLRHVPETAKVRLKLGPVSLATLTDRVAKEGTSVIDNLRLVRAGLFHQFDVALQAADSHGTALLASKLHENFRIAGRITGELAHSSLVTINNSQTNITQLFESPEFAEFGARLIRILSRHPAARDEVLVEFKRAQAPAADLLIESPHAHAAA